MKGKALLVVVPLALGVIGVYVLLVRGMSKKPKTAAVVASKADLRAEVEGDHFEYVPLRRKRMATPARFQADIPTSAADLLRWRRDGDERWPARGWFVAEVCAGAPDALARYEKALAAADADARIALAMERCPHERLCAHAIRRVKEGARDSWLFHAGRCVSRAHDAAFEDPAIPDGVVLDRQRLLLLARRPVFSPRVVTAVRNEVERDTGYLGHGIDVLAAAANDPRALEALLEIHRDAGRDVRDEIAFALAGVADPRARKLLEAACRRHPDVEECYALEETRREPTVDEVATRGDLAEAVLEQELYSLESLLAATPPARRPQLADALASCAQASYDADIGEWFRANCVETLGLLDAERAARAADFAREVVEMATIKKQLAARARFVTVAAMAEYLRGLGLVAGKPDEAPRWTFPTPVELMLAEGTAARVSRVYDDRVVDHDGTLAEIARAAGLAWPIAAEREGDELLLRAWDGTTRWEAAATAGEDTPDVTAMIGFVNALLEKQGSEARCIADAPNGLATITVACGPRRGLRTAVQEQLLDNTRF